MAESEPLAVYRLPAANRLLGFVVYCLAGPVIALMAGLIASGLAVGLGNLLFGEKNPAPCVFAVIAGLGVWIGLTLTVVRLYRRRAGGEVRIWPDRLEQSSGNKLTTVPYEDLEVIEYASMGEKKHHALGLRTREGGRLELPYLWPLAEIVGHLKRLAVPTLVRRSREALDRGESIVFREGLSRLLRAIFYVVLMTSFNVLLLVLGLSSRKGDRPFPWLSVLYLGVLPAAGAIYAGARFVRLLSNGMVLSRAGLRPLRSSFGGETRWTEVRKLLIGRRELLLEGDSLEHPFRLSRDAPNYLVLVSLIPEMAPVEVLPEK